MTQRELRSEDLRSVRIQVTTLGDLLLIANDRSPGAPALILPDERLTYAQLTERAIARARALQALGVKPRDHVGLLLPTCIEFVEFLFAIALCGAVAVPLNARYRYSELAYVIENGDLVTVITTAQVADHVNFVERLTQALPGLDRQADARSLQLAGAPRLRSLVLLGNADAPGFLAQRDFDRLAALSPETLVHETRMRVRLGDAAIMLYTSGTSPSRATPSRSAGTATRCVRKTCSGRRCRCSTSLRSCRCARSSTSVVPTRR
jgi:fatty-acyl-CoA synthase